MDCPLYEDAPEAVRERLRGSPVGDWFVFETIAADGSLSVGVTRGKPDPSVVMIVYEGLCKATAGAAAHGLARWYRDQGRSIADT